MIVIMNELVCVCYGLVCSGANHSQVYASLASTTTGIQPICFLVTSLWAECEGEWQSGRQKNKAPEH